MVTLMLVEDDDLEEALFARMRWNAPLSAEHAELLLDRLDVRPGAHVADLGCGWGELLLRVVGHADRVTGTGVDTEARALSRARRLASERHLDGRVAVRSGCSRAWGWRAAGVRVLVPATSASRCGRLGASASWRTGPPG